MAKTVFITGATGCIGHYIIDILLERQDLELHLLCRDPNRLNVSEDARKRLHFHVGNLGDIEVHEEILSSVDALIHIATDWSNSDYAELLNVTKTMTMFDYCKQGRCDRVVYFSTASILGPGNKAIAAARDYGTGYVRSKYLAHQALQSHPMRDKTVTVFPTLVFGGNARFPKSHVNAGLPENIHFMRLLRFFTADAACHFLHARDIAQVAVHALEHEVDRELVLGNAQVSLTQAIRSICRNFKIPFYFQIPISSGFLMLLAKAFRIEIDPWSRYCIEHPRMVYDVVNPETYGLKTAFPTLDSVFSDIYQQSKGL